MSELQFSLFLAALVVGYLLVHLRLVRFERYLRELERLRELDARLEKVVAAVERQKFEGVEPTLARVREDLSRIHADIAGLRSGFEATIEGLAAVERAVREEAGRAAVAAGGAEHSAGARIRAAVEARLFDLGYRDLCVLTDLSAAQGDERTEVRVEATRKSMPVKGTVAVRNGAVVDVSLQSVAKSFP